MRINEGWGTDDGDSAFSLWDENRDGTLEEDADNNGVFSSCDDDGNGVLEEPEFGDVGDDMRDGGFRDI